jgi:hypothetical protein
MININKPLKARRFFIVLFLNALCFLSGDIIGQDYHNERFSLKDANNIFYYRLIEKDTIRIKSDVVSDNQIDKKGNNKKYSFKKGEVYQLLHYKNTSDTSTNKWVNKKYWIVFEKDTLRFDVKESVFEKNYKVEKNQDLREILFLKDVNTSAKLISKDTTGLILVHKDQTLKAVIADTVFEVNGFKTIKVTLANQLTRTVVLNDLIKNESEDSEGSEKSFFPTLNEEFKISILLLLGLGLLSGFVIILLWLLLFRYISPPKFKAFKKVLFNESKDESTITNLRGTLGIDEAMPNLSNSEESNIEKSSDELNKNNVTPVDKELYLDSETKEICNNILKCLNTFCDFDYNIKKAQAIPSYLTDEYKNIVGKFKSGLNYDIFYFKWFLEKVINEKYLNKTLIEEPYFDLLTKNDQKLHQYLSMNGFLELVSQTLIYLQEVKNLPAFSINDNVGNWSYAIKANENIEKFKEYVGKIGFKINYIEVFSTDNPTGNIEIVGKDRHSLFYRHYISEFKEKGLTFPNLSSKNINVAEVIKIGVWSPKNDFDDYKKTIYIEFN